MARRAQRPAKVPSPTAPATAGATTLASTMPDTVHDQHAGHGGSYILDPKTGQRRLVERTQEAAPPAAEQQPTAPADAGAQE